VNNGAQNQDLDVRSYLSRVMEELADPAKRQIKAVSKQEAKLEEKDLVVDEADYVPASNAESSLMDGVDSDSVLTPQREIILKEIAAFRERSNNRERNKSWYEEDGRGEKGQSGRDGSPMQTDHRRSEKPQERDDKRMTKAAQDLETIPSGPAADRRRARDYHQSVKFRSGSDRYDRDEDEDVPDGELERRRLERKRRDLEAAFIDVNSLSPCFLTVRERGSGCPVRKCAHPPSRERSPEIRQMTAP
jgi:hypothetical protein